MTEITKAMPVYDALLLPATEEERADLLAAGPRWLLDDTSWGADPNYDRAIRAYEIIKAILIRAADRTDIRFTGLNRAMNSTRVALDVEDVIHGRIMWLKPNDRRSQLYLYFLSPAIHFDNLEIEPTAAVALKPTSPPAPPPRPPVTPRSDSPPKRKPASEATVRNWMEARARRAESERELAIAGATLAECTAATGATVKQAKQAWASFPQHLRRKRGQRRFP